MRRSIGRSIGRSIDSIIYWHDPESSAGLLAAGLGFLTAVFCNVPFGREYSSTAITCMLCLVHLLVSTFVQIWNSTKLVGRVGAAVLVTIVSFIVMKVDAFKAIAFIYVVLFIVHLSVSNIVQLWWTYSERGRVGVAVGVTAVLVALVLQGMALAYSMALPPKNSFSLFAIAIAFIYVVFFIFHLLVSNIVQLWWTYSERVGRVGVAAVLATIVFQYMALACSIACMYVMFFLVYRLIREIYSFVQFQVIPVVNEWNGTDDFVSKILCIFVSTVGWYFWLAATQDLTLLLVTVLGVMFAMWTVGDSGLCLIGFVVSFIVPVMYDKNKAFCDQKIAMLNRDKIQDKIEAFCDQKIALLKDNIVAFHDLILNPLSAAKALGKAAGGFTREQAKIEAEKASYDGNGLWKKLAGDVTHEAAVRKFVARRQKLVRGPALEVESAVPVVNEKALRSFLTTGVFDIKPPKADNAHLDTLLFHGTSEDCVPNIQATGRPLVNFSKVGMLGKGIYGAPDPNKAMQYCSQSKHGKFMFICRFNLSNAKYAGPSTGHRNTIFNEFCVDIDNHVVVLWMLKLAP